MFFAESFLFFLSFLFSDFFFLGWFSKSASNHFPGLFCSPLSSSQHLPLFKAKRKKINISLSPLSLLYVPLLALSLSLSPLRNCFAP